VWVLKEVYVTTIRKVLGPEPSCYCPKEKEEVPSELCLRCNEFVGDAACTYEKKAYWKSKNRK